MNEKMATILKELFFGGIAGTHVYVNDKGEVHVDVLTAEQCLDVLESDVIPEEILINDDFKELYERWKIK